MENAEISLSMNIVREAFLYQNRFKAQTMVFKIEFPVTEDAGFPYLMKDIGLLAKSGIRVVIVPGAAEYIDRVLGEHNIKSQFVRGERRTTAETIPYVEMAAFHAATRFMTGLSAIRVEAVVGNFVRARGRGVVDGIDMENTGSVDKIYASSLSRILDDGMVPILPCIGWSPVGKPYNVSGNEIAAAVSAALGTALGAVKLIIITPGCKFNTSDFSVPATVEKTEDGRILRLSPREAELVLDINTSPEREIPFGAILRIEDAAKAAAEEEANFTRGALISCATPATIHERALLALRLAVAASRAGVDRVHIINGLEEDSLLRELFSNLGAGTMVYADEYESIRPIRNSDIPDMLRLMEPLIKRGILLRRSAEDIQKKKDDYVVFVIDCNVHGCAALHDWGEGQAEIAALTAGPLYSDMGIGRRIVRYLLERATKQGYRRVFVMTVSTQDWFESLGFRETPIDTLPEEKKRRYTKERASKAYALDL
jgi:amino-acid N-acetyltransferase